MDGVLGGLDIPEDDPRFELWRLAVIAWLCEGGDRLGSGASRLDDLTRCASAWRDAYRGWAGSKHRSEFERFQKDEARARLETQVLTLLAWAESTGRLDEAGWADLVRAVSRGAGDTRAARK